MTHRVPRAAWWAGAAVVLGALLRFLYLDADPHYYAWIGYLTEEGRWVELARYHALSGRVLKYRQLGDNVHLLLAPLFQAVHVPLFELAGISLWTSRLPAALFGSAALVVAWAWLRRRVGSVALFLGVALLATQADLVMLSRVAIPETAAMLAALVVFVVLSSDPGSRRRICLAGVLTLVGAGLKVTVAALALVFALVLLVVPRDDPYDSWRRRIGNATLYLGVALGPLVAAVAVTILSGYPLSDQFDLAVLAVSFVQPASLYDVLLHPFDSPISPTLNAWCLAAWLCGLAWWVLPRERFGTLHRRALIGLATWCAAYYLPFLLIKYFPHRYQVHVLVPLALLAAVVADVLLRAGPGALVDGLERLRGVRRFAAGAAAGWPTAVILAPAAIAATVGFEAEAPRLLVRLATCAILWAIVGLAATLAPPIRIVWSFLLGFPPAFAVVWLALRLVSAEGFWPAGDPSAWGATWGATLVIAAGAWGAGVALGARAGGSGGPTVVALAGAACLAIGLLTIAPAYVSPRYTIRDASRDVGRLVPLNASVTCYRAEGLFNANIAPYRNYLWIDAEGRRTDYWVTVLDHDMVRSYRRLLAAEYEPIATHDLYVAPEYFRLSGDRDSRAVRSTVYRRRRAAPGDTPGAPRN